MIGVQSERCQPRLKWTLRFDPVYELRCNSKCYLDCELEYTISATPRHVIYPENGHSREKSTQLSHRDQAFLLAHLFRGQNKQELRVTVSMTASRVRRLMQRSETLPAPSLPRPRIVRVSPTKHRGCKNLRVGRFCMPDSTSARTIPR